VAPAPPDLCALEGCSVTLGACEAAWSLAAGAEGLKAVRSQAPEKNPEFFLSAQLPDYGPFAETPFILRSYVGKYLSRR
jgi:hypothetical protein